LHGDDQCSRGGRSRRSGAGHLDAINGSLGSGCSSTTTTTTTAIAAVVRMTLDVALHGLLRRERAVTNRTLVHFFAVMRHLVELEHVVVTE